LDDLEGHWQPVRSAFLATAGLLVVFKISFTDFGNVIAVKTGRGQHRCCCSFIA